MRAQDDIESAMERHGDAVWRVCVLYFRSHIDAQDAFQDAFLKYALSDQMRFKSSCADDAMSNDPATQPASFESEVIDAMRGLDDPPRTPLYLSLCEGYTAPEIANMVDAPVNTVYSWIARGKKQLKEALS